MGGWERKEEEEVSHPPIHLLNSPLTRPMSYSTGGGGGGKGKGKGEKEGEGGSGWKGEELQKMAAVQKSRAEIAQATANQLRARMNGR